MLSLIHEGLVRQLDADRWRASSAARLAPEVRRARGQAHAVQVERVRRSMLAVLRTDPGARPEL